MGYIQYGQYHQQYSKSAFCCHLAMLCRFILAQVFVYKAGTLAKTVGMLSLLSARVVYTVVIQFSEQGITVLRGIHFYTTMTMVFVLYEFFCLSVVGPG